MEIKYYKCGGETFELNLKPLPFKCKRCKEKEALVEIPSQGIKVCPDCFNQFFENRLKNTIEKYKMFRKAKKIGVFVSGGKDSAALLFGLKKIFPDLSLKAIYLNLGIKYYSELAEETVKTLCQDIDVPLYVYNLPQEEGYCIDEFVHTMFKNKICSVCGVIKRYLFSKIAKKLEIDVIATGHHLDDTVSTMLTLFFQGDFEGIVKLGPVLPPIYLGQATKVKPLYHTPEKEIFYYVALNKIPIERCGCPHGEITPSKKNKKILEIFEQENRQFKYQLLSVFVKKLIPLLKTHPDYRFSLPEVKNCIKCGEITTSADEVCSRCKRVSLLEKIPDKTLEVTPEEFKKFIQTQPRESWVVFDLREKEDFEKGAFEGALWIDPKIVDSSSRKLAKLFKAYRDKTLFFYCYTGRLSYLLTLKLRKIGIKAFNIGSPEKLIS
ncbi:phosphoadenosine phosphosulfate reductase family protein [Thermodesulfobacterium sp. TA1]|uniref:ATP-binding protein n=1 Tax=Thermodesulfobacterium sp. TA1 TaxID=2234087 RepID=UPI00123257F4|nr:ATP-binding protein [Thermodesulfobacterium sp. TA1]QER42200.1 phosphoadenosine phosphosulfate reductase family protein [Thermodesulfobacterium sp. TA1]